MAEPASEQPADLLDQRWFSRKELRRRGWTPAMIRRMLGAHDQAVPCEPPRRPRYLYDIERVLLAECEPAFAAALDRAQATTAAANARYASSASKEALIAIAGAIDLTALAIPDDFTRFVRTACAGGQASFADDQGRPFGWERVAVEFCLAKAAPLFECLDDYYGVPGIRLARGILRQRILRRIAALAPDLAEAAGSLHDQDLFGTA